MSSAQPQLYRQETDVSKSDIGTIDGEKGNYDHRETLKVPDTIAEMDEDTGGNVGIAEYERSKQMAEIVSCDGSSIDVKRGHGRLTRAILARSIRLPLRTRLFSGGSIGSSCLFS